MERGYTPEEVTVLTSLKQLLPMLKDSSLSFYQRQVVEEEHLAVVETALNMGLVAEICDIRNLQNGKQKQK